MTQHGGLQLDGLDLIVTRLIGLREAALNTKDAMDVIGAHMMEVVQTAFTTETEPETGKKWEPLAESTLKSKYLRRARSSYTGGAPLRRTGMLFNSISVLDVDASTVAVGSSLPHALYHNSDPVSPRRKFPRRQFLAFPPDFGELVEWVITDMLTEAMG
jgi:phage gpG-like protein